jgi:outer membrane protein assembly factor BamB
MHDRVLRIGLLAVAAFAGPDDWPGWRGPGTGVSESRGFPVSWSESQNIAWKTAVEGRGHSSPVVWGDRVFVTTDIQGDVIPGVEPVKHTLNGQPFVHPEATGGNRKHTLKLLCLDAKTGKLIWERTAYEGRVFDDVAKFSNYAVPTAVTDGKFVYAYFESQGLYKYDFDGKQIWKTSLGGIATLGVGTGVSPVLAGDKIVILADQDTGENSFIAAVSTKDGSIAWKTRREASITWTTPLVVNTGKRTQIVVPSEQSVIGYDAESGRELWKTEGMDGNTVHTPVTGHGMVFVSAGMQKKKTMAIRLEPSPGADRIAWRYERGTSYIPSPILYGDYLYLMSDAGLLTCLDAKTGVSKYEGKRVPKAARFMSPPVAFDGKLMITSQEGETFVIKAGPEYEILSAKSVGEPVYGSLALAGKSVYIRSTKHLICIR